MATNKLQWKRIAKGDKLPCQSFLRKKNSEILKLSTGAGVTVGQDAYYIPVDDVIKEIKNYPIEESKDDKMRKYIIASLNALIYTKGSQADKERNDAIAWLEKQGEHANFINKIQIGDKVTRNEDGVLVNLSQLNRVAKKDEKQGEQNHAWSEEDEQMLNDIVKDLVHPWNEYIPDRIEEEIKWLKNKLKSLKERYTWKPSDKQMKALGVATNISNVPEKEYLELEKLYQDLKKLREE